MREGSSQEKIGEMVGRRVRTVARMGVLFALTDACGLSCAVRQCQCWHFSSRRARSSKNDVIELTFGTQLVAVLSGQLVIAAIGSRVEGRCPGRGWRG